MLPDWTRILATGAEIDLAAAVHGGYVVDTSDRFFGEPRNMLMPYPAANMGDGWETKRRRGPATTGPSSISASPGTIRRVELDTAHFKGNYPDTASVEAAVMKDERGGVSADVATRAIARLDDRAAADEAAAGSPARVRRRELARERRTPRTCA